jgi:hypothetical protein
VPGSLLGGGGDESCMPTYQSKVGWEPASSTVETNRSAGQCQEGWEPPETREEQVSVSVLEGFGAIRN